MPCVIFSDKMEKDEIDEASVTENVEFGYIRAMFRCILLGNTDEYYYDGAEVTPRWIKNPGVDSTGMLQVFSGFIRRFGTAPLGKSLPLQIMVLDSKCASLTVEYRFEKGLLRKVEGTSGLPIGHPEGTHLLKWVHVGWWNA